jgi:hypothetical protein
MNKYTWDGGKTQLLIQPGIGMSTFKEEYHKLKFLVEGGNAYVNMDSKESKKYLRAQLCFFEAKRHLLSRYNEIFGANVFLAGINAVIRGTLGPNS